MSTDTLNIAKVLQNNDFSPKQAEALAGVVRDMEEKYQRDTITKDYLDAKLSQTKNELIMWLLGIQIAATSLLAATKFLG